MTPSDDGTSSHGIASRGAFQRRLIAILLIGLLARSALFIYADLHPARFDFPDSHRYIRVARNIAAGLGPMESETNLAGTDPLYPILLSSGIALGAESDQAIWRWGRAINIVASLLSIIWLALLTRRIFGDVAALIAAGILAIDPILLYFNALVLTETCYITLLLAGMYFIVRLSQSNRPVICAMVAGLMMGMGISLRSSSLFLPICLLPFVGWARSRFTASPNPLTTTPQGSSVSVSAFEPRRITSPVILCSIFLISILAVLAPGLIRNHRLFGQVVLTRTGGGASLLEALGPWADGGPGMNRIIYPPIATEANELERDQLFRQAAKDWVSDNPQSSLALAWAKLRRTWSLTIQAPGYQNTFYKLIGWFVVGGEFAMALWGAWLLRRKPLILAFLLLPALYFTLVHMVYVGSVRYRVPAMPLIFVCVGVAVSKWAETRRRLTI